MTGCSVVAEPPSTPVSTAKGFAPSVSTVTEDEITQQLAQVQVVAERPDVAGYDRDCGGEGACSFGPAWSDDNDGPTGHDGCDERNGILRTQLTDVEFRAGSTCVVVAGVLDDPYTGQEIVFTKAEASKVHVDHLLPLSAAWDLGASEWSQEQRIAFASDTEAELVAVDGRANMSKSDSTLSEWLVPDNPAYQCEYVSAYLAVSIKYALPITAADHDAATVRASSC